MQETKCIKKQPARTNTVFGYNQSSKPTISIPRRPILKLLPLPIVGEFTALEIKELKKED